jgi:hypothetical protein
VVEKIDAVFGRIERKFKQLEDLFTAHSRPSERSSGPLDGMPAAPPRVLN